MSDGVGVDNPVQLIALALVWAFLVVPVVLGIVLAVRTGNAWAPFERRENGRDGLLAPGRYFSALAAPRGGQRSAPGLISRWAFCIGIAALFGGVTVYNAFLR